MKNILQIVEERVYIMFNYGRESAHNLYITPRFLLYKMDRTAPANTVRKADLRKANVRLAKKTVVCIRKTDNGICPQSMEQSGDGKMENDCIQ